MWMAGKEATEKPKLVDKKGPKTQTYYAGSKAEISADSCEAIAGVCKGNSHDRSHAHHSQHCSGTKYEQICYGPNGTMYCRKHQERDGSRTRQAVHNSDQQR